MTTDYPTYKELQECTEKYGETNDCTVKALAQACSISYEKAHSVMRTFGRKGRKGVSLPILTKCLKGLGYSITTVRLWGDTVANMTIPRTNIYMIRTSQHIFTARDGKALDFTAGRRHRPIKCYLIEKVESSTVDHIQEKVIGVPAPRKQTAQRKWDYSCGCGCEFQLSTVIHNKMRRGQTRVCKKHHSRISFTGQVASPKATSSWIKIEKS